MRRILLGSLIGAIPGLLLVGVAIAIEIWVETGGGIGFGLMGLILMWFGIFVGATMSAARTDFGRSVKVGAGIGFAIGFIGTIVVSTSGLGIGGVSLLITPIAMIIGAVVGVWTGEHHDTSGTTATGR